MSNPQLVLNAEENGVRPAPVVSIIGKSGAGKTTLIERLIPEFRQRGCRVGTVKHHVHGDFQIDIPGKDSWRHGRAGSEFVVIVAEHKVATIRQVEVEPNLSEIIRGMKDVDLILTEGFHWEGQHKIEVLRAERSREMLEEQTNLLAIVTDVENEFSIPTFTFGQIAEIADFLQQRLFH
jgi:molybdopterin-guanine dinucleotide biosynthesis protein MobB